MAKFKVSWTDPETNEDQSEIVEFETWTGFVESETGERMGPEITITAREWAEDYGYTRADKGHYHVEPL